MFQKEAARSARCAGERADTAKLECQGRTHKHGSIALCASDAVLVEEDRQAAQLQSSPLPGRGRARRRSARVQFRKDGLRSIAWIQLCYRADVEGANGQDDVVGDSRVPDCEEPAA